MVAEQQRVHGGRMLLYATMQDTGKKENRSQKILTEGVRLAKWIMFKKDLNKKGTGRAGKKQANLQLQVLPSLGSFISFLPLYLPRPLSTAPCVHPNTPPLTLIGPGRVMWYAYFQKGESTGGSFSL